MAVPLAAMNFLSWLPRLDSFDVRYTVEARSSVKIGENTRAKLFVE